MRARNVAMLMMAVLIGAGLAACHKKTEPVRQSKQIVPPDIQAGEGMQGPTVPVPDIQPPEPPELIGLRLPIRQFPGGNLIDAFEEQAGSRTTMIRAVRLMLPPQSTEHSKIITPDTIVAYAIFQPEFGGVIGREGIFCFLRNGKPVVAMTTKILDYRTGKLFPLRQYQPQELAEAYLKLQPHILDYRLLTGKDAPFVIFFSESFRDAAIEMVVAQEAGRDDEYSVRSYGKFIFATDSFRGTMFSIASEFFPISETVGNSNDLELLLPNSDSIY